MQSTKRSEKAWEPDSLPNCRIKGIGGHFKAICDGFGRFPGRLRDYLKCDSSFHWIKKQSHSDYQES